MKKVITIFLCLTLFLNIYGEEKCLKVDKAITKKDFNEFTNLILDTIDGFKLRKLKVVKNDENNMEFSTNEYSFKIRRKTPVIGKLPEIKKAKWKKEKIKISANVVENRYCLRFDAFSYNKKDKKWHPVNAPGDFFEKILDKIYLNSLKEKIVYSAGSPLVIENGIPKKINNLQKFTIKDAFLNFANSKAVDFLLLKEDGTFIKASIPFIGDVKNVIDAYKVFKSNFVSTDLKKNVAKKYDFFWEYAIHGELMDGMHKNQLIAAFGQPYHIENTDKIEKWHFLVDGKELVFKIFNNELILPDDFQMNK